MGSLPNFFSQGLASALAIVPTANCWLSQGRYQNGCRYHLRYLISADCKAVRGKSSEVATSEALFLTRAGFLRVLRGWKRDVRGESDHALWGPRRAPVLRVSGWEPCCY